MVDTRNRKENYLMKFEGYHLYKLGSQLNKELNKHHIKHTYFRNREQEDVIMFRCKEDYENAQDIYKKEILKEEA